MCRECVTVTNPGTGETTNITTEHKMTKAIINRNLEHLHQTSETFFAPLPLSGIIPPLRPSTSIAGKFLQGDLTDFNDQNSIIHFI